MCLICKDLILNKLTSLEASRNARENIVELSKDQEHLEHLGNLIIKKREDEENDGQSIYGICHSW